VPSPDGKLVIIASNWAGDCGPDCGSVKDIKLYVLESPRTAVSTNPAPKARRR
jgi:hypothetical protein